MLDDRLQSYHTAVLGDLASLGCSSENKGQTPRISLTNSNALLCNINLQCGANISRVVKVAAHTTILQQLWLYCLLRLVHFLHE